MASSSSLQKKLWLWISLFGIYSQAIACTSQDVDRRKDKGLPPTQVSEIVPPNVHTETEEQKKCRDWSFLELTNLPTLPKTPYTDSFEQVWKIVLEKHFDPTLNCQDWPSLRTEMGGKLANVTNSSEAYGLMNELLSSLGQSHFRVIASEPEINTIDGEARLPLHLRLIDEQLVVAKPVFEEDVNGIPEGSILLAIGDYSIPELLHQFHQQLPSAGINFAFEAAQRMEHYVHCPEHYLYPLTYLDPTQQDQKIHKKVSCVLPKGEKMSLGHLQNVPTQIHWNMVPQTKIGYIAFNLWMLPLVAKVEQAMQELRAQGMESLILDIRGNPGGVGVMVVPVARMLLQDSASLGTLRFRDFSQELKVTGNPQAFIGPVFVLVDENTASTSEIFVAGMRDLQRIHIYGANKTAGAALPSLLERLADGALFQYVVGDYQSSKGTRVEGQGITPDVLVHETREDLSKNLDPVFAAAIDALKSKQ